MGRVGATLTVEAGVRTVLIQKFSGKMCADAAIRSIAVNERCDHDLFDKRTWSDGADAWRIIFIRR